MQRRRRQLRLRRRRILLIEGVTLTRTAAATAIRTTSRLHYITRATPCATYGATSAITTPPCSPSRDMRAPSIAFVSSCCSVSLVSTAVI
eukprot:COSAG06_NODE_2001_length_7869_cov_25.334363_6_plen_90_part_00